MERRFFATMAVAFLVAALAAVATNHMVDQIVIVFMVGAVAFGGLLAAAESQYVRERLPFAKPFDLELDRLYEVGSILQHDVIHAVSPTDADRDSFLRRMHAFDEDLWRVFRRHARSKERVFRPGMTGWTTGEDWREKMEQALTARLSLLSQFITGRLR